MLGGRRAYARLMCGAAMGAIFATAGTAAAAGSGYDIAPQPLALALKEFGLKTGQPVLYGPALAEAKVSPGVADAPTADAALAALLTGTGLTFKREGDTFLIVQQEGGSSPQDASAGDVDALIVTAQKREENIQDVPIAMSAFTQEALERSQIAGGPDLMTQVPNMTFTKTNFTGYSIQIRGIGTQAVSATTDAAVAVAFNNTPFIRNRFFEQEFYDVERVEVLRGPQGTLYGRNATAGVVNLISAKPVFDFASKISGDIGNYNSRRLEGMINIPLSEDTIALRVAGAWTKRDGYSTNQITGKAIDGRDLWSTRATLALEPNDRISAFILYEHFEESDDRLRSGKQVCNKDPGPATINGVPVPPGDGGTFSRATYTSQGCLPASIYGAESFQTPNGFALPFYGPTQNLGNAVLAVDPYLSATQSRDLRVIESMVDPEYQATTDVAEIQVNFDLTSNLTLASETAYSTDSLSSLQDYNRFNTKPGAFAPHPNFGLQRPDLLDANNVFCDPQLGCSDRLLLVDLSTAESSHFSQEFRLSSDFDGPFNFSLGANFLRYDTEDKYYVFVNSLSMFAAARFGNTDDPYVPGVTDNLDCQTAPARIADPTLVYFVQNCVYLDPNPIGALNDQGRNYFLSKNPYRLISYAGFGEAYYNVNDELKLTGGFRWTVDKKRAPQIPSWLLASQAAGDYKVKEVIDLEWSQPTGRVAVDWQPQLGFTDHTLVYASFAHGYKAGGANPPSFVLATYGGFSPDVVDALQSHPKTFEPEFIDAFEIGTKNTLLDGRVTVNLGAFYYDYEGYQISQIIDRSAVNLNFDAEVWGAEIEADWRPTDNLRLGFKGGYQNTRMADGSGAVDTMDRTDGQPGWVLIKPFPTIPSNCILPEYVVAAGNEITANLHVACSDAYYLGFDPITGTDYVKDPTVRANGNPLEAALADYPGFDPTTAPNGGSGFTKDLSGNELPNAPHFTTTLTADYTAPLANDWMLTLHADLYYQSEAWTRVFNTEGYDKLKAYTNINLAAFFRHDPSGLQVMAYIKNVMNRDSITGAFLNSDDTGLTTNVFVTEPRLYGVRLTKQWDGVPLLGRWMVGRQHAPGKPFPFQVELGVGANRFQADSQILRPDFVDAYQAPLQFPMDVQEQEFDWGDQRHAKLTYAPPGGWRVSAAYRYGKTKSDDRAAVYEQLPDTTLTNIPAPFNWLPGPDNYGISSVAGSEEHTVVDFAVGKDIGIGAWFEEGASTVSVGLRHAQLRSKATLAMLGTPDWYWPAISNSFQPTDHHSEYEASLTSDRSFEGAGPVASWDASRRLIGDVRHGKLGLDWTIAGGVLFGKQKTQTEGELSGVYSHHANTIFGPEIRDTLYVVPLNFDRSREVAVPTLGGSLGLSYAIDRVNVSAGYQWERYFDAIDGGIEEARSFDRTIHGPYLKLSFGFGG